MDLSSVVLARSSFGIFERLNELLLWMYSNITTEFGHVDKKKSLKMSVKAMNDTIGEILFVQSQLVFGVTLHLSIIITNIPKQKERMEITAKSQMEMNSVVAEKSRSSITKTCSSIRWSCISH